VSFMKTCRKQTFLWSRSITAWRCLLGLGPSYRVGRQQLDALDEFCDAVLMEWMTAVMDTLQDCERAEDALRLHDLLSPVLGSEMESWLPERHFLLLSAGRKEEATAEMERLLSAAS
jgi:hypothetical protein